jgi:hypothetical protein
VVLVPFANRIFADRLYADPHFYDGWYFALLTVLIYTPAAFLLLRGFGPVRFFWAAWVALKAIGNVTAIWLGLTSGFTELWLRVLCVLAIQTVSAVILFLPRYSGFFRRGAAPSLVVNRATEVTARDPEE